MSRTYVHTPAWVKERDPFWRRNYTEYHNHSWYVSGHKREIDENGRAYYKSIWTKVENCDLDVYLAAKGFVQTACHIQYMSTGRNIDCGCKMCTSQISRRQDRRSSRHEAKGLLHSGRWDDRSLTHRHRR